MTMPAAGAVRGFAIKGPDGQLVQPIAFAGTESGAWRLIGDKDTRVSYGYTCVEVTITEAALSAAREKWVPVAERLPEPEVDVLCYGPNMLQADLPWIIFVDWYGSKPDFGRGVTHWMSLPHPPTASPTQMQAERGPDRRILDGTESVLNAIGMRDRRTATRERRK